MILVDSDHFSIISNRHDRTHAALIARLKAANDVVALPIVVVEEVLRGRLAKLRRVLNFSDLSRPYDQLAEALRFLNTFAIASWNAQAAQHMAAFREARIRIGTQDLRIASIALATNALLVSANLQDFEQVPGLRVEDWLR